MIYKCKMCGGDVEVIESTNTGKCLYCKSTMTLPISDNEKIINLYNRANDLRLDNEFDKAIEVYEEILKIDNNQVEAHWGLILCKYGVEYVDDPKTKKKIPTCRRTLSTPVTSSQNYRFILKNAYGEALELYRKQAKEINNIQKGILEISALEEPYDIFICYKETDEDGDRTKDSVIAQDIYDELVKNNYRVFFSRITLEDKLGTEYEPYIYSALKSSKIMIVVGTCFEHLDAVWVKNEWSRYIDFLKKDKSKTIIPVYSQMDAYDLPDSLAMYQSQNMDKLGGMQDLIHGVNKIMGKRHSNETDISDETIRKLKEMLEKEKDEDVPELYETNVVSISPSYWFQFCSLVLSVCLAIWMFQLPNGLKFIENFHGTFAYWRNEYLFSITEYTQVIFSIVTLIAFVLGFVNRKTHIASKFLYLFNILLEVFYLYLLSTQECKPSYIFYVTIILSVALLLLNPKWSLKNNPARLTKEEQARQIEINSETIDKFKKTKYNPLFYIIPASIGVIAALLSITFYFQDVMPQDNNRNLNRNQLKIKTEFINILEKADVSSKMIGQVYDGEWYTILDTKTVYDHKWYEIETEYGVKGYIYGGDKNEYVELYLIDD